MPSRIILIKFMDFFIFGYNPSQIKNPTMFNDLLIIKVHVNLFKRIYRIFFIVLKANKSQNEIDFKRI